MGSVAAIANDPNGKASIEAVVYEDRKKQITAALKFNSKQASVALVQLEKHKEQLERKDNADYQRVVMVFRQANVKDATIGKRTGEWVLIEEITDRELPLIYASDLTEKRIKHEIREAEDNLFKKGFVVDVNVVTKGGQPIAYRVTNLHQVIDLPDDN
jgi:Zn/Cd-binding protein ZinT